MKRMTIQQLLSFPNTVRLDDFVEYGVEMELTEDTKEALQSEIFKFIRPGKERTCVILRTYDFDYNAIAFVLGIKQDEAIQIMHTIRQRLMKNPTFINLTKRR